MFDAVTAECSVLTAGLAVAVLLALVVSWLVSRPGNLPPGPAGLPLVGYLPFLGGEPHKHFDKLRHKYGSIFSLYLGRRLVVVLGDFTAVKEGLSKSALLSRPPNPPNHLLPDSVNFSIANGPVWKEQRRFALRLLRDLGVGKQRMEDMIQNEIACFLKEMVKSAGKPCDVRRFLTPSVSNNIVSVLFGRRMAFSEPDRLLLDSSLSLMTLFFRPTRIHAFFPDLRKYLAFLRLWGYHKLEEGLARLAKFLENQIDYHRSTLDKSHIRDYIDGFLIEMDGQKETSPGSTFTRQMLKGNVQSLLGAGSTPTRATIEWLLVTMAAFPEVQRRVQKEIDEVVGRERLPCWADHPRLTYMQAIVMEVQRWKTVIPIGMLRCTYEDITVGNFSIPKGTTIITNFWAVHHDSDYWEDPHNFRPERFLDPTGTKVVKPDWFLPFSYGKRACPGESLGVMEVFLYVSCILHQFFVQAPPHSSVTFEKDVGIAQLLKPYKLCLTVRQ